VSDRDELESLRRLADLEARARGGAVASSVSGTSMDPINVGAFADTVKDLPRLAGQGAAQTLQGFMDLPVGGAQLASKFLPQGAQDAVSSYMREREKQYAPLTGAEERPGDIQPGRIGGNVAFGLALSTNKAPAGLLGRMTASGKVGAGMGLLSPVDPDNQDYLTAKGIQVGVGGLFGFLSPAILEGILRGVGATANWIGGKVKGAGNVVTAQTRPLEVETKLEIELQKNGVDWSKIPEEMRSQIVGEVQTALKSGGKIDTDAVRRLGDFAKLGIRPTKGQLTRDPYQWGNERNLGKMEVGKPITDRLTQQNQQMINVLDRSRNAASLSPDEYATGQGAIQSLKEVGAGQKAVVDKAYEVARSQAGIEADVPLQPVAQKLGQVVEDFGDDKIPSAVMKRLNEFGVNGGQQKRVFNIREAEKLKTLIDNNIDGPGTPAAKALGELKRSVDEAINSLADDSGSAAATAFKQARSAASQRFDVLKTTPALADVMDRSKQLAPEKFVEQYFVRGDVNSVKSVMKQIPANGRAEVQAGVMDWIRKQAVLGDGDTAQLSAAGIKKALDSIGDRKLAEIFRGNGETLNDLMALKRVAAYIDRAPKSSSLNTSGSGTMLADMLDKISRLPVLGAVAGKPGDIIRATQVSKALSPVPVMQPAPMIPPELMDRLAPQMGLLGGPAAGAGVAGLLFAPQSR
jgi:hypothetical protein